MYNTLQIKTANGDLLPLRFPINEGYVPEQLKVAIWKKYGILPDCMELSHNGSLLLNEDTRPETTIRSLGIQDGDVLQLIESTGDRDCNDANYLNNAAAQGHNEAVRYLIEKNGLDVNAIVSPNRETPLYSSQWHGNQGIVDDLIGVGADVNLGEISRGRRRQIRRPNSYPLGFSIIRNNERCWPSMIVAGASLGGLRRHPASSSPVYHHSGGYPVPFIDVLLESGMDARQLLQWIDAAADLFPSVEACL